jgi:hypothetical protein
MGMLPLNGDSRGVNSEVDVEKCGLGGGLGGIDS